MQGQHAKPMSSKPVTENHALVTVPVALIIQVIAKRIAAQADRTGALHAISATPVGGALLWLLVIGFIGMALWRLSEAVYGSPARAGRRQVRGWPRSGGRSSMA